MPLRQLFKNHPTDLQNEMQLILNALVEGICGLDARGNATFCNEVLLSMTGYSTEEVIGKNAHALMHGSRPAGTSYREEDCALREALDSGQKLHLDRELIWQKCGTSLAVEYWVHPLQECSSETVCVVTVHDISERELATAALRTSEERFQQISNNIDQAFYLVDVIGSRLVYASPAFETITGHSCQEVCEKPSPWRDFAVPDHREKVIADYNSLIAGEETKSEYQIRRSDGTTRWIKDHAKPIRDTTGQVCMFAGVAEDITAIHEAREVLHQSEERFRRILTSVAEVAWTSDQKRRTIYVSPKVESVLGYTKEEICSAGSFFRSGLIHPEDFGRVNRSYNALFEGRSAFDEEYRIRRRNGSWIWIHDRAMGVHQEEGVLYADGVFSDITRRKQAEAELQWKTAFLEAQAESTIDGILVVDGSGRMLRHNRRFVEMFGMSPELASDPDHTDVLKHATSLMADPAVFMAKIDHLNRHPSETSRDEIELKNGTVVDRYSAPVIDKKSTYYGRIWTFRDISERKRNEERLRRSEAYLAESQRLSHIGSWAWKIDQRECVFWSEEHYRMFGMAPGDGIISFDKSLERIHPEDIVHFRRVVRRSMLEKKDYQTELRIVLPDGSIRNIHAIGHPITDKAGELVEMIGLSQDITERKVAERELRLTKISLENASDAVHWLDANGRFVYVNDAACRCLGRSREELLCLSVMDIDPSVRRLGWRTTWEQVKARRSLTFESQNQAISGKLFPVEITANYVEFDGQEYSFAFVRDISERRELEAELRQAHKLEGIGQLSAGIAHEINTPTQFVTDDLTFLRDSWKAICKLLELYRGTIRNAPGGWPPGANAALDEAERELDMDFIVTEVPRAIEQSLDGAQRVAKIVRAMKAFSHPDSTEKTNTDLNRAIESTITVARNEWKYVAEVKTDFDEALPAVLCYPGDINQVILNVLVNAAHAIKERGNDAGKGLITIRTRTRGEFAEISVADTGTGIPEAISTRVFDPFFTTKEVGKGTGQGLSLAHSLIVKKHAGKIWFETEMGRGTTFFIDLPINPQ
jgi:PAS domain S-box-containing protein